MSDLVERLRRAYLTLAIDDKWEPMARTLLIESAGEIERLRKDVQAAEEEADAVVDQRQYKTLYEAQESRMERLRDAVRWRDVRKEAPAEGGIYLVLIRRFQDSGPMSWEQTEYWQDGWLGPYAADITHWLPIPELPEDEA